ncbi:MAG: hypothetical protein DRJ09_12485 [Bacteroidetes bacterium]|nr:MAG: hypothetical protein DRJ09_12485 [Bacteroidota bacterium]
MRKSIGFPFLKIQIIYQYKSRFSFLKYLLGSNYFYSTNQSFNNNKTAAVMKSGKILIVDDNYDVITTLETILQNNGYHTISASDKKEGKILALNEKPDLAILDVMMTTHYEGFELAKEFAENEDLRNIKVLMQTSIDIFIRLNIILRC